MTEAEKAAREIMVQLLTVAEALRPSMPRVSDLMDSAAEMIEHQLRELEKIFQADR